MVDYSKWKDIEISDDEDDTHPNIDTPSLFRWRHQARVERMAQMEKEREDLKRNRQSQQARLMDIKDRLQKNAGDRKELEAELKKVEDEGKELTRREEEFRKKEKKTPWNVDTISQPGFQKTVINKKEEKENTSKLTDEEHEKRMKKFINKNEKLCKEFGMLRKYDDSLRFLQQHYNLVCEEMANYLVIWSINLEMEGKHDLMAHVAHQCICMQYLLELSKQLKVDPRACVVSFFTKIQNSGPEYKQQFESEIEGFKERIKKRAIEKLKEMSEEEQPEEEEEEELTREQRLGPGGLDPAEVFETLPDALKKCFESRDIDLLKKTIDSMPIAEANYHMQRCVDSGLWVCGGKDDEKLTDATADDDANTEASKSKSKSSEDDSSAAGGGKNEAKDAVESADVKATSSLASKENKETKATPSAGVSLDDLD